MTGVSSIGDFFYGFGRLLALIGSSGTVDISRISEYLGSLVN